MQFENEVKPLNASFNHKIDPQQKVFFYERHDGSIIHVKAEEAWEIENQKAGGRKPFVFFKQIGVSDGAIFHKAVMETKEILKTQGLEAAQEHLRQAEQQELEKARGHLERPPVANVLGPGASELIRKGVR